MVGFALCFVLGGVAADDARYASYVLFVHMLCKACLRDDS